MDGDIPCMFDCWADLVVLPSPSNKELHGKCDTTA